MARAQKQNRKRVARFGAVSRLLVLLLLVAPLARSADKTPSPAQPDKKEEQNAGAPVTVGDKPIFYVQARVLSFSPEERAQAIAQKVRKLSKGSSAQINEIRTVDAETTTEIVSGDMVIMTVTQPDADAAGRPRQELAAEYAQAIRSAAESLRKQTSLKAILLGLLWAVIATAVFLLVLRLLAQIFPKVYRQIRSWQGKYIRSIRIQRLELLPAERITGVLLLVFRGTRIFVSLVLFYFYVSLVFSFFPWTRGYAAVLLGYVLYPLRTVGEAAAEYLPNIFFIIVISVVSYYLTKVVKFFFQELRKGTLSLPGFYPDWAEPTYKIARFLIIAFTTVVIFPYLPGSKSPAFQGISIFLGLLFSLGSSSAISNIVAGVVLTYTRAFQVGDRVKVGDAVGDVTEKTLLVTRIRTIKNVDISIPNALVLGSHIINFSSSAREPGLILNTSVTIGYDTPWVKIHELLIEAAKMTENVLQDPSPFVLQTGLNDFYVTYEINAYTCLPNKMAVTYSNLHQNIQNRFYEAGVEIMSPHYTAVRDGNAAAIPESYLPKDYSAPPFRVSPLEGTIFPKKDK